MSTGNNDLFTGVLAGSLSIVYTVFAHYASATPGIGPWAILLAGAPLAIVGFSFARGNGRGVLLWLLAVAAIAGLAWAWPRLQNPVSWLYFVQHVSINAVLGLIFGRSLIRQRQPLCTVFARVIHEQMTPALLRYTRQVTLAWTLFFLASAVLSVLLFFFAPIETWSVFANVLSLPLVVAMFVVENQVRKHVLPIQDQVGILATVRAFRSTFRS
jgi:uncharacterized membrane protein